MFFFYLISYVRKYIAFLCSKSTSVNVYLKYPSKQVGMITVKKFHTNTIDLKQT